MAYSNFTIHIGNDTYSTITLGNEVFSMKSDVTSGPTIDNITMSAFISSTTIYVKVGNANAVDIDAVVTYAYIDTSSKTYGTDTWTSDGTLFTPVVANAEDQTVIYFDDGCQVSDYDFIVEFYYDGELLGSAEVSM